MVFVSFVWWHGSSHQTEPCLQPRTQTNRHTHTHTHTHTRAHRQTGRQADKQTDRQTDKQRERERNMYIYIYICSCRQAGRHAHRSARTNRQTDIHTCSRLALERVILDNDSVMEPVQRNIVHTFPSKLSTLCITDLNVGCARRGFGQADELSNCVAPCMWVSQIQGCNAPCSKDLNDGYAR